MNHTVLALIPLLVACAGPSDPWGDWDVTTVATTGEPVPATGILEVDRDGETLFRVTSEPVQFDAFGRSVLDDDTANLLIFDGDRSIDGPCTAADGEMTCDLEIDDDAVSIWLIRESGA